MGELVEGVGVVRHPVVASLNRRRSVATRTERRPNRTNAVTKLHDMHVLVAFRELRLCFRFRYRKVWRFESSLVHPIEILQLLGGVLVVVFIVETGLATFQRPFSLQPLR